MTGYLAEFADINGLPLVACLLVSGILVYLGMHVVERKVIFVDLALAQIAALGVMWAILMGYNHEEDTLAVTLYSLAFTVVGAVVFSITRTRHERVPHEALIGIIYVTATAAGLVLADRFALGTEALKELIAGRVALVTGDIIVKLAITCAAVGAGLIALHRTLLRISTRPEDAEAAGLRLRLWDFVFYLLFGVVITQTVSVLGVLPVFAYLVIPAVAAAFLFETPRARLIFGWVFAGVVSLLGLETARLSRLDPGPTIVCLFAGALVVLGVGLFLRARRFSRGAVIRAVAFAALFAAFLAGTLVFRKPAPTDELATAIELAGTGEPARLRQALQSFRALPARSPRWAPLVIDMLDDPDPVVREEAASLLGDTRPAGAVGPLSARLQPDVEDDDVVREAVVVALRAAGDPAAVPALVAAAQDEIEPDIAVQMSAAALAVGGAEQVAQLRAAVDVLVGVIDDDGAPRAARRDAGDRLRAVVDVGGAPGDAADAADTADAGVGTKDAYAAAGQDIAAVAAWWRAHRDQLVWQAPARRFTRAP